MRFFATVGVFVFVLLIIIYGIPAAIFALVDYKRRRQSCDDDSSEDW